MPYLILGILLFLLGSNTAFAYVGPGLGLGVIGAIVGVVGAIFLAIIGVFWYPIKRMFKKNRPDDDKPESGDEAAPAEE